MEEGDKCYQLTLAGFLHWTKDTKNVTSVINKEGERLVVKYRTNSINVQPLLLSFSFSIVS